MCKQWRQAILQAKLPVSKTVVVSEAPQPPEQKCVVVGVRRQAGAKPSSIKTHNNARALEHRQLTRVERRPERQKIGNAQARKARKSPGKAGAQPLQMATECSLPLNSYTQMQHGLASKKQLTRPMYGRKGAPTNCTCPVAKAKRTCRPPPTRLNPKPA